MTKNFTLLCLLVCSAPLFSQFNVTLRSNVDYEPDVNDVWGYVAPDGTEYAIVGMNTGISIVSLADPDNATEVAFVPGVESIWRDMKTYGEYAYAVADQGADGLTVIDLSELPARVSSANYQYEVPGFTAPFVRAHNIYIDTTMGIAFTAGGDGNVNSGGMIMFDVKADPAHPPIVALGPNVYSHDVFVQDSIMYASEIYRGELAIYDIHRLDSIVEVGRTRTPYSFTHNAWVNAENTTVFTTDEKADAPVTAYDITDLSDIRLLDEFRPLNSLNTKSIPHNVHVIDNYLSISSYSDGLRVVDASDPTNLIEIANYDTYLGPDGGFNGDWGAFPFLPSGLTLVSDRYTGLFVVEVDYKRAARLEGTILDGNSSTALNNARVEILTDQLNQGIADANGAYATGIADAGTYSVVATADGYYPDTVSLEFQNGITLTQDFVLSPRVSAAVDLTFADRQTGALIMGGILTLINPNVSYTARTDSSGTARLEDIYDYSYSVLVTAWGYQELLLGGIMGDDFQGDTVYLERGYEDSFTTDLGWSVESTTSKGFWERGKPVAIYNSSGTLQPGEDSPADFGDAAYFTELRGGAPNTGDVDRGETVLTSPYLDLTGFGSGLMLTYDYWWGNYDGSKPPANDSLKIELSNGDTTILIGNYRQSVMEWTHDTVFLDNTIGLTDSMRLVITAADQATHDNAVEAGFDNFRILDSLLLSPVAGVPPAAPVQVDIYPNPATAEFNLNYDLRQYTNGELEVFSISGRRIYQQPLPAAQGAVTFGNDWNPGLYLVRITAQGKQVKVAKVVKM